MHVRVKKRMPLGDLLKGQWINSIPQDRIISEIKKGTEHVASVKPERRLGAGWIDSLVNNRRQFCVCGNCYKKYIRHQSWWQSNEYAPVWNPRSLTDCDGCSNFVWCIVMVPEEAPLKNAHIDRTEGSRIYVSKW
jgi:hypothetical protein